MEVLNQTQQVRVFGKTYIQPGKTGTLPEGFEDHEHVKRLLRLGYLAKVGASPTPKHGGSPMTLTEVAEAEAPTPEPDLDVEKVLEKWAKMPAAKCIAWAKTFENATVLARMAPFEKRKTVLAAIEARITELGKEA